MVIAQITDIHISPDRNPVHNVDVVRNFQKILSDVCANEDVTHIALTGDICFNDPLISIMEWVKTELDRTGLPYYVIPGNHDDSVVMAQVFDLEHCLQGDELYYNEVVEEVNLIFLDSAKGSLSVDQIAWLKSIDKVSNHPSLIFMHHPPVDAVPYMDKNYALEGKVEMQNVLAGLSHPRAVFCGHYHISKAIRLEGMPPVFITPSTFFQIDDQTEEFRISTKDIGWRRISLESDVPEVEVKWLEP